MTILEDESESPNEPYFFIIMCIVIFVACAANFRIDWVYASLGVLGISLVLGLYASYGLFLGNTKSDDKLDDLGRRMIIPIAQTFLLFVFTTLLPGDLSFMVLMIITFVMQLFHFRSTQEVIEKVVFFFFLVLVFYFGVANYDLFAYKYDEGEQQFRGKFIQ